MFWLFHTPRLLRNGFELLTSKILVEKWLETNNPLPSKTRSYFRLEVRIAKRVESINRFRSGREGVKGRDLEKKYPPEKAKKLMDLLRSKGLWYWDEDFPQDEED